MAQWDSDQVSLVDEGRDQCSVRATLSNTDKATRE